jgi:hypothetical protein
LEEYSPNKAEMLTTHQMLGTLERLVYFEWWYVILLGLAIFFLSDVYLIWKKRKIPNLKTHPDGDKTTVIVLRDKITVELVEEVQYSLESGLNRQFLDIVIHSDGGTAGAAVQLVYALAAFPGTVRVWVPFFAHSAASLVVLGLMHKRARVYMGRTATLSVCDPTLCLNEKCHGTIASMESGLLERKGDIRRDHVLLHIQLSRLRAIRKDLIVVLENVLHNELDPAKIKKICKEFVMHDGDHQTRLFNLLQLQDMGLDAVVRQMESIPEWISAVLS